MLRNAAWNHSPHNQETRMRGFTLIEILVVMVIVGMVAGMAVLVVGGNKEKRELENQARKMLAIFQLTQEEAVLQNIEIGVELKDKGYRFRALDEEKLEWTQLPQDFLKDRSFPDWLEIEFNEGERNIELPGKEQQKKDSFRPQLLFLSSGESTPFSITLKLSHAPEFNYILATDGLNGLTLKEPADET